MLKKTKVLLMALTLCMSISMTGVTANASSLEDDLSQGVTNVTNDILDGEVDAEDAAIGDWISEQRGMTADNLENASTTLSPLANIAGNIIGGIVVLVFLGMFFTTAIDLLYIAFPPIRNVLYKGNAGAQQGGMPMTGGYGGGRFGSMMGGMMGQQGGGIGGAIQSIQWISDEAIQCVAMAIQGGGAQPQMAAGNPMMAGMAGGMPQQQAPMSTRSTIGMYMKKRMLFMILLAMCVIVLTSSALLGTGVNLAMWLTKIINAVNGNIPV